MERSRAERKDRERSHRRRLLVTVAGVLGVLAIVAVVVAALGLRASAASKVAVAAPAEEPAIPVPAPRIHSETPVEVPKVTGKTFTEAELVLGAAGFVVHANGETTTPEGAPFVVASQSPPPGTKLGQGEQVTLTMSAPRAKAKPLIVVLDPGHQAKPNLAPEPVGPGSAETKEKATAGASGVATKRQECEVALEVALRMKPRLEAHGIQVLLTRTSNNVDLSNVQRAKMANEAGADLFVRVHADAAMQPSFRGVSVLYQAANKWTRNSANGSKRAADLVQDALVASTGEADCGVTARSDLSGFNWSEVPAILVEAGFLSNVDEDKLLATPGYQEKVAQGTVAGILKYLGR